MRKSSSASRRLAGDRRPAEHRRHRAGSAADDDVLRRHGLEDHGIDDGVADEGGEREPHGEVVHPLVQDEEAQAADRAGEHQGLQRRHLPARQWPAARARHHRVDLLLDQAVDRGGGARGERDAEGAGNQRLQRHHARRRQEHPDHRREDDERHHARLGQLVELAEAGGERQARNAGWHLA